MNNTIDTTHNSTAFTERQNDTKGLLINGTEYENFNKYKYDGDFLFFINTGTFSGKLYLQRNFMLTFTGGIVNYICTATNSLSPIMKMPCSVVYYSATVANSFMQLCYVFRAFRLILLYKLNIFKVTILDENKFIKNPKEGTLIEPNIYYKSIYKLVNKKLVWVLYTVIETVVAVIAITLHVIANVKYGPVCGLTPVDINARINSEIHGKEFIKKYNITNFTELEDNISTYYYMRPMLRIPEVLTVLFVLICVVITVIFLTTEIKDSKRFGIKFDCVSTAVITVIIGSVYLVLRWKMEKIIYSVDNEDENKDFRFYLKQFYLRTKQGLIFFVALNCYIQLTSVVIPLIQCIYTERENKKYENKPINEIQYFYKVLKQPELVEELKEIAIQEFSVENILFWENYCLLRNLAEKVIKHHKEVGGGTVDSYNLFSLQDIMYTENSLSSSQPSDESYDPNYPLLPQLVPYYNSFYYTFIDMDGPAAVDISDDTMTRIRYEFNTDPTVGIFDEALSEVVENMFFSIYPIFLNQNGKQVGELCKHEL
ncbi:hypothetical protein PIROE2DRAFT_4437 [Piromyces sp. E2]|nr:hypothetical protein PIROE2DRAFT_4437 [Piromyces sp. E2]|eukprot:OUM68014.1 hypothetical protein PIROE2DRAFT_4437 [Piromyces sp. E2]